jgi:hypothetical protein
MGDKEVKQWLKDARDLIKSKEYKNALKEVKKVLNRDKGNYMGLVFCGLCLSELEEPVQALQVGRQYFAVVGSVLDRRRFDANPGPTFHFDATSVGHPASKDPHVFWPPGSGSISEKYGSGSGSGSLLS